MITRAKLKKAIRYDPDSGEFFRLTFGGQKRPGDKAGHIDKHHGYVVIGVFGKKYRAHNLAYLFMTGKLPPKGMLVDHINRISIDNRWNNLRLATLSQSNANRRSGHHNRSTLKGAHRTHNKVPRWTATIGVMGKRIRLGHFKSPEEAHAAYRDAAIKYFGEFACLEGPGLSKQKEKEVRLQ